MILQFEGFGNSILDTTIASEVEFGSSTVYTISLCPVYTFNLDWAGFGSSVMVAGVRISYQYVPNRL